MSKLPSNQSKYNIHRGLSSTKITSSSGRLGFSDSLYSQLNLILGNPQIRLIFKNIKEIDIVEYKYIENCQRLYLSQNYISSLSGITQFNNLQHLSISFNSINEMHELQYLAHLAPTLQSLSLEGNPICSIPAYKSICIRLLPNLRVLDGKPVTLQDRQDILDADEVGALLIPFMYAQQRAIGLLQQAVSFLRLKFELYQRAYGSHAVYRAFDPPDESLSLRRQLSFPSILLDFELIDSKSDNTKISPQDLLSLLRNSFHLELLTTPEGFQNQEVDENGNYINDPNASSYYSTFIELFFGYLYRVMPPTQDYAPLYSPPSGFGMANDERDVKDFAFKLQEKIKNKYAK